MSFPRLKGKVCIVTGSSSGLGRAIAIGYAREGALLVCADLRPQARAEVEQERDGDTDQLIRSNGGKAIFVKTDVSKTVDVEALVVKTVSEYGRLDV
jgi:NAD(P)-dependent dehydrogenase (short-subunit alcohol dehydrogenase family)